MRPDVVRKKIDSGSGFGLSILFGRCFSQCCWAGRAEIIWGPEAGAENKFAVRLEDVRTKKSLFLSLLVQYTIQY